MTDESTKPDVSSQDDDLALLPNLDEKILLEKLQKRYGEDVIYTYVGDILIAVNPFKSMTIYGNEVCEKYQNVKQRSKLPPHVYAIGDHMYRSMRTSLVDQVCVISGESGAGKTETAKLLVRQVLHVSRSVHPDLQAQILKVNPLLEALGNARTIMNNNSSRFGKFLKLHFNANAVVTGASIAHYLLEKSRVVTQNEGERNFHIFYLMFAGLTSEEKEKYELHEASDYKYLFNANSGNSKIANRELAQMKVFFKEVTDAMKVVGFDDEDYTNIFNLLAAILHLGQLNFTGSRGGQAEFTNKDVLLLVAQLLCLEPAELAKALTIQVTVTRGETIRKPNTIEQASEFRNSFAKFLYGHLFSWVVKSLNLMLSPSALSQAAQLLHESDTFRGTDICILDIFGFENFKVNSFEQFCINVANEQLQYYFNQHIFRWEQEEYAKEGISPPGTFVFADNKPIIELFFAKPLGMFNLLDDETKFPRASAKTLVEKFNEHCDKNTHYVKSRQSRDPAFGVKHYAGLVTYNCESFLIKNRDALSVGLLECIKTSKNDLIQAIVTETDAEGEKTNPQILLDCQSATQAMRNSRIVSKMLRSTRSRYGKPSVRKNSPPGSRRSSTTPGFIVASPPVSVGKPALSRKSSLSRTSSTNLMEQQKPMSLTVPEEDGRSNVKLERTRSKRAAIKASMRKRPAKVTRKGTPTIGFYFKCSLASLMEKMLISVPHFVRCIKPNSLLVPDSFDDKLVVQQLRYTGVLETTRIRQLGYPTRLDFGTFLERYSCLQPFSQYKASRHSCPEDNQRCCVLLDSLGIKDYAIGETKVFLRYHHNETLFNLLERREQSATVLQKVVRGFLARCYFQQALVDMFCQEVKETSADLSAKLSMLMRIDEDRHQRRLEEERLERERQEQIRLQREKEEQERLQREKEEAERIERVRREKEKFVRMEQERLQRQKEEKEFQEQLQLKRQKDQEERAKAAALKKQQQQQQQLLQKEKEAQRIEKERSDQEITKVEQSDRSMPGAAAVYRRRSKVNPLERDGGDMPRTHQQQLDQMRDSTGLHDEVEKVKKEIAVVEFETEETCLAHQNILSQTEDILKEANTIRRSPVSGRSATTKSPAVVSASSPSSRVKTKRPWCVVTVMERDIVCGTYSLYPRSFTIDGSENMSASVIGINGNPPVSGHDSVNKVRPFVGKGVEIEITADGSVRAIRRSKNPVILKGRSSTLLHCHPNTELEGDVMPRNIPQEIFSASTFKQHVKDVMAKTKLDLTVLFCLCRVGIGFVRNTSNPHSTPCWAIVDFVVPHLKVNEYLQRRAVKSKRSASPWSQADIFDPRMLCFTAPMPVSSRSNYTLLQKDSDESAFTTTSPTANGSSSASAQDKTCGADALSPQYSIVNRDHSTRAHASESDAMSHTAASRTQTTGVASGRTLSSGSSLHSTTSLAPSSSGQVLSNAAATGVASNDSSPFAASRARMWAKRSKVTGSKDKA
ncbi:unconventional myosin-IXb-like isoform X4 [Sycon ciliatum]|uniref:unconventional myosin-IXb-like isoform X4 n=1 Tax=Sycon ciliatum TaxID=27933 RepID=UPI0031F704AC